MKTTEISSISFHKSFSLKTLKKKKKNDKLKVWPLLSVNLGIHFSYLDGLLCRETVE